MIQSAKKRSKMELAMSLKKNMQALIKAQKMIVFLYYKIITFFCDCFKIPRPKIKNFKKRFLIEMFFNFWRPIGSPKSFTQDYLFYFSDFSFT